MSLWWVDRIGGVASAICALHCLVLSFAPSIIAALDLGAIAGHEVEWALFLSAVGLAVAAAATGFATHRTWWVLVGFSLGIVVLCAGRAMEVFGQEGGGSLAVVGGVMLVASHLSSARCCAACEGAVAR